MSAKSNPKRRCVVLSLNAVRTTVSIKPTRRIILARMPSVRLCVRRIRLKVRFRLLWLLQEWDVTTHVLAAAAKSSRTVAVKACNASEI